MVVKCQSGCILGLNSLESLNMVKFDQCVYTIDEDDYDSSSQVDETIKTRKVNFDEIGEEKQTRDDRKHTTNRQKEKQIEEPQEISCTEGRKKPTKVADQKIVT